jgi:adenylosuccinate synthase
VHKARAEFEMMPGWDEDISAARTLDDLPPAARTYVEYIAGSLGVPIVLTGVGPSRDQVIWTSEAPARFADTGTPEPAEA